MIQLNSGGSANSYEFISSFKSTEINENDTSKNTNNQKDSEKIVRSDSLLKREINKVAERLQNTSLYTEEAAKVIAENLVIGTVNIMA